MSGSGPADVELVEATRAGCNDAFATLYRQHHQAARAAAAGLGVPRCDRDDVVDEAFMNVLAAIRNGRGPRQAFRPYLLAAVRNIACSRARHARRVQVRQLRLITEARVHQLDGGSAATHDTTDLAEEALRSLPTRWQRILHAVDIEGRRASELAPELGVSVNAAQALLCRARRGLQRAYLEATAREEARLGELGSDTALAATAA